MLANMCQPVSRCQLYVERVTGRVLTQKNPTRPCQLPMVISKQVSMNGRLHGPLCALTFCWVYHVWRYGAYNDLGDIWLKVSTSAARLLVYAQ